MVYPDLRDNRNNQVVISAFPSVKIDIDNNCCNGGLWIFLGFADPWLFESFCNFSMGI